MIQRLQTVFLLIASVGLTIQVFFPLLAAAPNADQGFYQDGLLFTRENTIALVLVILAAALALISIFLYKNLGLQKKVILGAVFIVLASVIVAGLTFSEATRSVYAAQAGVTLQLGAFMPILGLLFLWLSYRYVTKDQKIIKSMDRLR